jgi:hypothetical protein
MMERKALQNVTGPRYPSCGAAPRRAGSAATAVSKPYCDGRVLPERTGALLTPSPRSMLRAPHHAGLSMIIMLEHREYRGAASWAALQKLVFSLLQNAGYAHGIRLSVMGSTDLCLPVENQHLCNLAHDQSKPPRCFLKADGCTASSTRSSGRGVILVGDGTILDDAALDDAAADDRC